MARSTAFLSVLIVTAHAACPPLSSGWSCASPPTDVHPLCGPLSSAASTAFSASSLRECSGDGGGALVVLGDSVSRHALFDWLSSDVAGCGGAPGTDTDACAALANAASRRSHYVARLTPRGGDGAGGFQDVAVSTLPDDAESAVRAVSARAPRNGAVIVFLSATFVRNATGSAWLAPVLRALAHAQTPLLVNAGLWNVKYDAESGAGTLKRELSVLASLLDAALGPSRVSWRSITATDARATFPAGYTSEATASAADVADGVWRAAGFSVAALRPLSQCAHAVGTPKSGLTVDGTHLGPEPSIALMRAWLRDACGKGRTRANGGAFSASSRELETPASAPAASPAPKAAVAPPLGGAAYAAGIVAALAFVVAVSWLSLFRRPLETFIRTIPGALGALVVTLAAVYAFDVVGVLPIVEKAKPLGFDSLLVFFTIVLLVALRTVSGVSVGAERSAAPMVKAKNEDAAAGGGGAVAGGAAAQTVGDATADAVASSSSASSGKDAGAIDGASRALGVAESGEGGALLTAPSTPTPPLAATAAPPSDAAAFFPIPQSLEWKGWMMTFFLLYHYWDVKPAYNAVRVAVGAYLFLTGYGNYVSLSKKGPSLVKLALSVLRINLFTFLVMATSGRGWVLYYIAPLHTLWTVVVYAYFWLPAAWSKAVKLGGILAVIVVVYEVPGVSGLVFLPLYPLLGYCGGLKEWIFRSRLDAYAPFFGMAFAAAVPHIVPWLDGVGATAAAEDAADASTAALGDAPLTWGRALGAALSWTGLVSTDGRLRSVRAVVLGTVIVVVALAHSSLYATPRFEYNATHRLTEWLPICTWLLIRNLTPALRRVHLRLFAWLGEMSLELYILQFHVWLAADAHKIVVPFPQFRALSFIIATLVFVALAGAANHATGTIIKAIDAHGHVATLASAGAVLLGIAIVNAMPGSCALDGGA